MEDVSVGKWVELCQFGCIEDYIKARLNKSVVEEVEMDREKIHLSCNSNGEKSAQESARGCYLRLQTSLSRRGCYLRLQKSHSLRMHEQEAIRIACNILLIREEHQSWFAIVSFQLLQSKLHGIFKAVSCGQLNIDDQAWSYCGRADYTPCAAQVSQNDHTC